MKIRFFILVVLVLFVSEAFAQTRCYTDSFGNTICKDSHGISTTGSTNTFVNSTWQPNPGNGASVTPESFENSNYPSSNGSKYRTYNDSFGNTTRCITDSFGNTTCQ